MINCCLCGTEIKELLSHNAQPVKDGRCCLDCNFNKVVPARMKILEESNSEERK